MVERLNGIQKVRGSTPLTSTIKKKGRAWTRPVSLCGAAPSKMVAAIVEERLAGDEVVPQ